MWRICYEVKLTLVLLNLDMPCLTKQCRSRPVGFWISQLIWICLSFSMWISISNLDQVIWFAWIRSGCGIFMYPARINTSVISITIMIVITVQTSSSSSSFVGATTSIFFSSSIRSGIISIATYSCIAPVKRVYPHNTCIFLISPVKLCFW